MRAPGVARLGFSAMVVANLEGDVPGIRPGLVTDLGDKVSAGRTRIASERKQNNYGEYAVF